jgi:hypothetical protein
VEQVVDHLALMKARFGLATLTQHCREVLPLVMPMELMVLRLVGDIRQAAEAEAEAETTLALAILAALVDCLLAAAVAAEHPAALAAPAEQEAMGW